MTTSRSQRTEMGEDISAFVGKGVDFKGTITYQGTVRIDGSVEGEIQTDGILLVGEEAVLKAKVTAGTIVCKGKITGDIVAKEKIKLRAPAVITGGVKTPMLSMEEGVTFNGTLEMASVSREMQREPSLRAIPQGEQPIVKRITA
ncbi:MAG: polymer-forming cytoskeletal protein [Nitrospira sp.]|nr:polymer-forming cytoskeletal protein [Nitrospira sp.]MCP9442627.1 polymer-forming cytoskeletal protein [Nitrospira sp.]